MFISMEIKFSHCKGKSGKKNKSTLKVEMKTEHDSAKHLIPYGNKHIK